MRAKVACGFAAISATTDDSAAAAASLRVDEERHRPGVRLPDRRDAVDAHVRVAAQLAAETNCELPERDGHGSEASGALKRWAGQRPAAGFGAAGAAGAAAAGFGPRDCNTVRIAGVMSTDGVE
jgi:hypothetical protein